VKRTKGIFGIGSDGEGKGRRYGALALTGKEGGGEGRAVWEKDGGCGVIRCGLPGDLKIVMYTSKIGHSIWY
jgi:hypothetical protein